MTTDIHIDNFCSECGFPLDGDWCESCGAFDTDDSDELNDCDEEAGFCTCGEELDLDDLCPVCDYCDEDDDYWDAQNEE